MKRYKAGVKYHFNEANHGDRKNPFTRASAEFSQHDDGEWVKYDDLCQWKKLDFASPATWPEEYRKIWIVSDTILFEQEEIAYFGDGQFYYSNGMSIDSEYLEGVYWQYVVLPQKPPSK